MTHFILDASALGKRYVPEPGTVLVDFLMDQVEPERLCCLTLGALETLSIIVRAKNGGRISRPMAEQAIHALALEVLLGSVGTLAASDDLIIDATVLVETHNVNSTDAVLLQAALRMHQELAAQQHRLIFVSADHRLLRAADREGLTTFDPETDTLPQLQALASA